MTEPGKVPIRTGFEITDSSKILAEIGFETTYSHQPYATHLANIISHLHHEKGGISHWDWKQVTDELNLVDKTYLDGFK